MFLIGERHLRPPTPHRVVGLRNAVKEPPVDHQLWPTDAVVSMGVPAPALARQRALREAVNPTGSMGCGQQKQFVSEKKEPCYGGKLSGAILCYVFATGMASHSVVYLGDLCALAECQLEACPAVPKLIAPGPCWRFI